MTIIPGDGIVLVTVSRALAERRIAGADFTAPVELGDGHVEIRFPSDWPGAALGLFSRELAALPADAAELASHFAVIDPERTVAVGAIGLKGDPDPSGAQEIGYGMNPDDEGRGYATRAVAALAAQLRSAGLAVSAETLVTNVASRRVLEKNGFRTVGQADDPDDGPLLLWRLG